VRNPPERITSREGLNAAQSFFERHGCVFQEVAQQNDFGKDAYVDIGEDGAITFLCVALQVKSGTSYRTANGDYFIPVDGHAHNWRYSTVPIFGLVYDPDDSLMRWVDVTGHLCANLSQQTGNIPVSREAVLTEESLHGAFTRALAEYVGRFGSIAASLLATGELQTDAVYDAWALGRSNAKYLLIIRRFILDYEPRALRRAIHLLAHAGLHPDILWIPGKNWIPESVTKKVTPSFRWASEEIVHMLKVVDPEDWGRATLGQSLDVLLYEDPNVVAKLHIAIRLLLKEEEMTQAVRAATLALTHSRDQRIEIEKLVEEFPALLEHEWFRDVYASVGEAGKLSMY
jgi:hypothetical protein